MNDVENNPMGLDGFEFVEFAALERGILEPVFTMMGFTHVANHRSKNVVLFRQGILISLSIMSQTATPIILPVSMVLLLAAWPFESKMLRQPTLVP